MGFRSGSFAKVWEVNPKSEANTVVRLSISKKNKMTGEYEDDFSGFVGFVGAAAAKKAACLNKGDRIRLGDVDVSTFYDKNTQKSYTNFKCFSFDVEDTANITPAQHTANEPQPTVDDGEVDDDLPF